jgi:hypothetical protein
MQITTGTKINKRIVWKSATVQIFADNNGKSKFNKKNK